MLQYVVKTLVSETHTSGQTIICDNHMVLINLKMFKELASGMQTLMP